MGCACLKGETAADALHAAATAQNAIGLARGRFMTEADACDRQKGMAINGALAAKRAGRTRDAKRLANYAKAMARAGARADALDVKLCSMSMALSTARTNATILPVLQRATAALHSMTTVATAEDVDALMETWEEARADSEEVAVALGTSWAGMWGTDDAADVTRELEALLVTEAFAAVPAVPIAAPPDAPLLRGVMRSDTATYTRVPVAVEVGE